MKSESKKLGQNLKRIRKMKGKTQGDIVRALKMDRSYVSRIESGRTNPTLSTIAKLAKFFGVSSKELLN